jgi:cytochrome c553
MASSRRTVASVFAASMGLFSPAMADDAKLRAYGKHLASECTSCHRIDGVDNGIPSITGWPTDEFVETLKFYKDGSRPNQAMRSVAGSLDDEQFAALAAFFSSLPKPRERK